MQVLYGARQVGKTTLVRQVADKMNIACRLASADEPTINDREWISAQWQIARAAARKSGREGALLVLDEVQKIPAWTETVKRLWDEDTQNQTALKVVLPGSAPLLIGRGLSESLAGRFEMLHLPHWSFSEMREAFDWDLNQFLFYGAYPGAAPLVKQPRRWSDYIKDSIMETTVSRDVLLLSRIDKPALLRRLMQIGCSYSGQILSYTKLMGQLQDAGNTTTLAHYLDLLSGAGMLTGLHKYARDISRARRSSPKFQVFNTALITAQSGMLQKEMMEDSKVWGRLTESAVGAHLVNGSRNGQYEVSYWRDRNREVDFVLRMGKKLLAIEVKSGRPPASFPGLANFVKEFQGAKTLIVGQGGVPLEDFLSASPSDWMME